jgi:predicted nucleic acid-binding protein
MSLLVDTNILVRSAQPTHPLHEAARNAVSNLLDADRPLYFTLQNICEFWNVATRPIEHNGLGYSIESTLTEIARIEGLLGVLPDAPEVYEEWKRLVSRYRITGTSVHDARLVAMMNVHGVREILTFDRGDFARYDEIAVVDPIEVASQ